MKRTEAGVERNDPPGTPPEKLFRFLEERSYSPGNSCPLPKQCAISRWPQHLIPRPKQPIKRPESIDGIYGEAALPDSLVGTVSDRSGERGGKREKVDLLACTHKKGKERRD